MVLPLRQDFLVESESVWTTRSRRRRLVRIALVMFLFGAVAGTLSGGWYEIDRWTERFDSKSAEASRWKSESVMWEGNFHSLQRRVRTAVGTLQHPTFLIWNVPQTIPPHKWLAETVPDTFDLSVQMRASSDVIVFFATLRQYRCFEEGSNLYTCLGLSTGNNSNLHSGTDINVSDFDLAEGCGGWVMVTWNPFPTATTVTGTLSVTRNPAATPTAGCF
jgi:hypothetical protein